MFSDMIEIGKGNRNINEEVFYCRRRGMTMEMKVGMKYEAEIVVNEGMLAITMIAAAGHQIACCFSTKHDQSDGTDMREADGTVPGRRQNSVGVR